jgi:hypothetical protein
MISDKNNKLDIHDELSIKTSAEPDGEDVLKSVKRDSE